MFDFAREFSSYEQCEAVCKENRNDRKDDDLSDGRKRSGYTSPHLLECSCLLLLVVNVKDRFALETLQSAFVTLMTRGHCYLGSSDVLVVE